MVTAGATGWGTITISSPDVESAILLVRVEQIPASLTLSPDSATLEVDETATLRASIVDANGHSIKVAEGIQGGLPVYWATSDSDVATVHGNDITGGGTTGATATVTAVAAGDGHDHGTLGG